MIRNKIEKMHVDYLQGVVGKYLYDTYGLDLSEKGFDGMDASITDQILSEIEKALRTQIDKYRGENKHPLLFRSEVKEVIHSVLQGKTK